jgi:hypothetical protein
LGPPWSPPRKFSADFLTSHQESWKKWVKILKGSGSPFFWVKSLTAGHYLEGVGS